MTYYDQDVSDQFGFGHPIPTSGLRGVCVHTSEGNPAITAYDLAHYQWTSQTGSYNVIVDLTGHRVLCNTDNWQTWSTGNQGNDILLHICFTARADWTREQWLAQDAMLRAGATVVRHWLDLYGWPARKVDAWSLPGVLGHADTQPWGGTDHTDPGQNFPYDVFLSMVTGADRPAPTPQPEEILTPDQAAQLATIHHELTVRFPSRSRYRASDDLVDTLAGMVLNIDARAHENLIERAALMGDEDSIALVRAAASRGDHLAQVVVDRIDATGGTA